MRQARIGADAIARSLRQLTHLGIIVRTNVNTSRVTLEALGGFAEEVTELFPDARLALLSSDLVPGLMEMRAIIARIEAGEADIVIGTQMVAKGHHFPGLAMVGVVDGDLGLAHGADPRAAERTFQLLHQVTGRAGRALVAAGAAGPRRGHRRRLGFG